MEGKGKVASALLEVGALRFDEKDPFVYASSKLGPVYMDLRRLPGSPSRWAEVVEELTRLVEAEAAKGSFQVVSGGEVADLLFSIPVAMRLGKPHVVIRKAAKTHGLGGRIAGLLQSGQRVVHVSDLITTGASALDWVGVIREAGCDVRDYFVVLDRNQGGAGALEAKGVRLHSLITLDADFVELAVVQGLLERRRATEVESYLRDPEGWAERLLLSRPELLGRHLAAEDGRLVGREGLEILTKGYPSLLDRLGGPLRERLTALGVKERIDSVGYRP